MHRNHRDPDTREDVNTEFGGLPYVCAGEVVRVCVPLKTAPDGSGGGQRGGSGAGVGGRKRGGAGGAREMSDRCGALDVALRA